MLSWIYKWKWKVYTFCFDRKSKNIVKEIIIHSEFFILRHWNILRNMYRTKKMYTIKTIYFLEEIAAI